MSNDFYLKKKILLNGTITLETGLFIGAGDTALSIGGIDKTVVRNPVDQKPYIPGSSLKGKMRALFELANKEISLTHDGAGPSDEKTSASGSLFGVVNSKNGNKASRLIVRDAKICGDADDDIFKNTDLLYTESKFEVGIDRITAKANPRQFERVPAGAQFDMELVLNVYEGDDENGSEETLKQNLFAALTLLQDDYLGGQGSRGYGQVRIAIEKMKERPAAYYMSGGVGERSLEAEIPRELSSKERRAS